MRKTLLISTLACLILMSACSTNENKTKEGEATSQSQIETETATVSTTKIQFLSLKINNFQKNIIWL